MRSTTPQGTLYPVVILLLMLVFLFTNYVFMATAVSERPPGGGLPGVAAYSLHRHPDHRAILLGAMVLNLFVIAWGCPEAWRAARGHKWRAYRAGQMLAINGILSLVHVVYAAVTLSGLSVPVEDALVGRVNLGVIGACVCTVGAAWCFRYSSRTDLAKETAQIPGWGQDVDRPPCCLRESDEA